MDVTWVKIKSWHVVRTPTRAPDRYRTMCGLNADGPQLDDRPGGEKTCETCLRLVAPK